MGIVKKDAMKFYWSVDRVLSTPFPKIVISRSDFKGQPGYDPRKKLGKFLTILQEQFA